MDENTRQAFEWAISQKYQSVAARYARTLAEYVKSVGGIENERDRTEQAEAKLRKLVEAAKRYLEDNHYGAPRRQRLEAALAAAKGE
jgi:hypothetical protein